MATLSLSLPLPGATQLCAATRLSSSFPASLLLSHTSSFSSSLSQFPLRPVIHLPFYNSPPHPSASISDTPLSAATDEKEEEEEEEDDEEEELPEEDMDPCAEVRYLDPEVDAESITEWEVDFCSRPILDDRGKKLWELVVCDATLSLQFTRFFPNNVINSITLKDAISSISTSLGVPMPDKIRFFRSQMSTIITKACNELGIKPIPSKRCISLVLWLEERFETVYKKHPGYQKGSKPLFTLDNPFTMNLPQNLFGEQWAFVQLPFSAIEEEVSLLEKRYAFGQGLDLDLLGFEFGEKQLVPGLAVASSRATPLAAWMSGLEVSAIEVDTNKGSLILSVGVSSRYLYATYEQSPAATLEAEAWEASKKECGGLHFLAIQERLDSESCVGFWLLLDLPAPPV